MLWLPTLSGLIRAWLVDDYITCHHGDDDLARRFFRYYYDDTHVLLHGRHRHDDAHDQSDAARETSYRQALTQRH